MSLTSKVEFKAEDVCKIGFIIQNSVLWHKSLMAENAYNLRMKGKLEKPWIKLNACCCCSPISSLALLLQAGNTNTPSLKDFILSLLVCLFLQSCSVLSSIILNTQLHSWQMHTQLHTFALSAYLGMSRGLILVTLEWGEMSSHSE